MPTSFRAYRGWYARLAALVFLLLTPLAAPAQSNGGETRGLVRAGSRLAQQSASPAAASTPAASSLDYEVFRTRVQPIFMAKRQGLVRCIQCHARGGGAGGFAFQPLAEGQATWTDEQSRKNFEAVLRVVAPGDPTASRLLMHPLARTAGGDPFHGGGKHWSAQSDPEWQTLAQWVKSAAPAAQTAAGGPSLDFEFYRTRVEPIFLKARAANEGSGQACASCHSSIATRLRLQPVHDGATPWTLEDSRKNFEAVSRLVDPGDPLKSRLLVHPLAPAAGGDPQHTGGKFWGSQDHPEFQTLVAWVKTGSAAGTAASTTPTLDFQFYRTKIEPIFFAKRQGLVRCVQCHGRGAGAGGFGFQAVPEGATAPSWSEEQSRRNFDAVQRVIAPGDPTASRLLMHPLARSAGGDPFHGGGKHWSSQNDPEWQTLAAWVKGQTN